MARKQSSTQQKDKEKGSYLFAFVSFCLCITLIFLPLYLFEDFIKSCPLWFQPIIIIIFGSGGIALYVIIGFKLKEIEPKLKRTAIHKKHPNERKTFCGLSYDRKEMSEFIMNNLAGHWKKVTCKNCLKLKNEFY